MLLVRAVGMRRLVELAGGVNAYDGGLPFPSVSAEGILSMNPDVIIEVLGDITRTEVDYEHVGRGLAQFTASERGCKRSASICFIAILPSFRGHVLYRSWTNLSAPCIQS